MNTQPTNLVSGLSAEIERVRLKQDRWEKMLKEMPELGIGMSAGISIMRYQLQSAREALNSGEIEPMLAAIESLREYDDND